MVDIIGKGKEAVTWWFTESPIAKAGQKVGQEVYKAGYSTGKVATGQAPPPQYIGGTYQETTPGEVYKEKYIAPAPKITIKEKVPKKEEKVTEEYKYIPPTTPPQKILISPMVVTGGLEWIGKGITAAPSMIAGIPGAIRAGVMAYQPPPPSEIQKYQQAVQQYTTKSEAFTRQDTSFAQRSNAFTSQVNALESKWKPFIKGNEFLGNDAQYSAYQREFNELSKRETELNKDYVSLEKDYVALEKEQKELEKKGKKLEKPSETAEEKLKGYTWFTIPKTLPVIGKVPYIGGYKVAPPRTIYKYGQKASEMWLGGIEKRATEKPAFGGEFAKLGMGALKAPAGLITFGATIPIAFEALGRQPLTMARSMLPAAKYTISEMGKEAVTKPVEFAGEQVSAALLTWGVSKGLGRIPLRPSITKAPGGISVGIIRETRPSIFKPVELAEYKPLITFSPSLLKRTVSLGEISQKKIKPIIIKEGWRPETPFETKLATALVPEEALKITEGIATRRYTIKAGIKIKELTPIIRETLEQHKLTKSTNIVTNILKNEKADLYGSVIQKAAGRKVGVEALPRTPRDFDVKVDNPTSFAKKIVNQINKAEGRNAVEIKNGSVFVKHTGAKLFDIHSKVEISPYGSPYLAYGLKEAPLTKTKEGISTISLSEQMSRKLHGAMVISEEPRTLISEVGLKIKGKIAPAHEGRIKDIADYYFGEKANIAGLKLKKRFISAKKANEHLEKWLSSWGENIAKDIKKLYTKTVKEEGGEKAWLGSFDKYPYSPSKSYKVVTQIKYIIPTAIPYITSYIPSKPSIISKYPPAKYPPAKYPPTKYPPAKYPPTKYLPAKYPPTKYLPAKYPPTKYPPAKYPPTKYPPAKYPPTKYPPAKYPPTKYPPTKPPEYPPTKPPEYPPIKPPIKPPIISPPKIPPRLKGEEKYEYKPISAKVSTYLYGEIAPIGKLVGKKVTKKKKK